MNPSSSITLDCLVVLQNYPSVDVSIYCVSPTPEWCKVVIVSAKCSINTRLSPGCLVWPRGRCKHIHYGYLDTDEYLDIDEYLDKYPGNGCVIEPGLSCHTPPAPPTAALEVGNIRSQKRGPRDTCILVYYYFGAFYTYVWLKLYDFVVIWGQKFFFTFHIIMVMTY